MVRLARTGSCFSMLWIPGEAFLLCMVPNVPFTVPNVPCMIPDASFMVPNVPCMIPNVPCMVLNVSFMVPMCLAWSPMITSSSHHQPAKPSPTHYSSDYIKTERMSPPYRVCIDFNGSGPSGSTAQKNDMAGMTQLTCMVSEVDTLTSHHGDCI